MQSSQFRVHQLIYSLSILFIQLHIIHLVSEIYAQYFTIINFGVSHENVCQARIYLPLFFVI